MRRIWLLCLFLFVPVMFAQDSAPEPIDPELKANLDELALVTEAIRGLTLSDDIALHFPSRDELRQYIDAQLNDAFTGDVLAEQTRFYTGFDFLPRGTDLQTLFSDLYTSQVAGFYDSETKEMNVILMARGAELGTNLPILERVIYVHEYTHALQDEAFDLTTYLQDEASQTNGDRALARLALVEGDATATMTIYLTAEAQANPIGTMVGFFAGGLQAGNLTIPEGTPAIVANELLFPYQNGQAFVQALYDADGWEGINNAFSNPPASTEQILHPEKYFAGELPQTVTLVDASQKLGAEWTLGNSGMLGEFYLLQYLDQQLTLNEASLATSGWGGDAYHIYVNADGDLAIWLRTVWDTEQDQQEFADGMQAYAQAKFGMEADASGCYANETQALCASGGTVLIAPTIDLALTMVSE